MSRSPFPVPASTTGPIKIKSKSGFISLVAIAVLAFIFFARVPAAPVGNFVGALFVGIGGMLMVGIRLFAQNTARLADKNAPGGVAARPWVFRATAALVSWVKRPTRKAKDAEKERLEALTEEAAATEKTRKAVEDTEDLGFALLGLGGLIVAAAALQPILVEWGFFAAKTL